MLSVPCPVSAQEPADAVVQAPRLLNQVAPRYPPSAPAGAHGDVSVRVTVNAQGQVVGAQALSGPEVFHAAAEDAARQLRWEPGSRQGQAVQTDTLVRFHFVPPEAGVPAGLSSADMVVEGEHPTHDDTRARTTLDATDIERSAGQDLASTVEAVPGVTAGGGTANQSKPIIRGQTERRLLLQDGVRHESQKWGADPPRDRPVSAGQIGVIKGAAGVRYGPDAIGSVVLVEPPPMRSAASVGGRALVSGASNGQQGFGALRVDVVQSRPRRSASGSRAATAAPPACRPPTTSSATPGASSSTWAPRCSCGGLRSLRASWQRYDLRAGIFYDVASDSPSGFLARLERDRPLTADLWSVTYDIDRPRQEVVHDRITLHATSELGDDATVELVYAYQVNHREEFETVQESVTGPVRLSSSGPTASTARSTMITPPASALGRAPRASRRASRRISTPATRCCRTTAPSAGGCSATGGCAWAPWTSRAAPATIASSGRPGSTSSTIQHLNRGTLGPDVCEQEVPHPLPRRLRRHLLDPRRLVAGRARGAGGEARPVERQPNTQRRPSSTSRLVCAELPRLRAGVAGSRGRDDVGLVAHREGLDLPWIAAEVSGFANLTTGFIYFAPEIGPSGSPTFEVTIAGTWPRFTTGP